MPGIGASVSGVQAQYWKAIRQYNAVAKNALNEAEGMWNPIIMSLCNERPSTGPVEEYNWADPSPAFEKWTDERPMTSMGVEGFTLRNEKWGKGIWVKADDLEDDRLNLYNEQIQGLVTMGVYNKFDLVRQLFINGFTADFRDGKTFFADDHPLKDGGGVVNDNLFTGALSNDNFKAACTQLRKIKNSAGREMMIRCSHLIVGEDNEWLALEILKNSRLANGEDNIAMGSAQPLVIDGIGTKWAVADLRKPIKPFILQNRRGVRFTAVTNPESDDVFHKDRFKWGADWRGQVGYNHYEMMVGSLGS